MAFPPHIPNFFGVSLLGWSIDPVVRWDWEFQTHGEVRSGIPAPQSVWIRNSSPMAGLDWEFQPAPAPEFSPPILDWDGEVALEGLSQRVLRFSSLDFNPQKFPGYQPQNIPWLQLGRIWDHPKSIPKQTKSFGI